MPTVGLRVPNTNVLGVPSTVQMTVLKFVETAGTTTTGHVMMGIELMTMGVLRIVRLRMDIIVIRVCLIMRIFALRLVGMG